MTHLVIGTAGHIDHGKSSLVKALTGTDPDRFAEEKQRGLTIDIGFAFLGDSITFIDVPGHEKFIKNMVSGVAGIDAVMLVIAADDGIMLQTKEHLDILNLLHVKQGFVALTKIDLVEKDWLELVNLEIEEFLQGTFLENAPIFNVSSTKSDGIDKLSDYLKTLSANQKKDSGVLRMPIDRSFSIEGFGTVVTGTVMSGNLKSQDSVEILPLGKRVKVRGIQSHGKMISSAKIGDRVALNLQNISKDEPGRGQVICQCGFFEATDRFYAEIKLLKHIEKSIKNNERLRIHLGTTEYLGRITTEKNQPIQPGESRLCYIRLESKGMVFHGQPMVIRRYSPPRTIAGGVVLTYEKIPHSMKKNQWFQELQFLAKDDLDEKLNGVFLGKHFLTRAEIFQKLSQRNPEIQKAIDYKIKSEKLIEIQVSGGRFVAQAENLKILKNQLVKAVEAFHKNYPMKPGLPIAELSGEMKLSQNEISAILEILIAENFIVVDAQFVRCKSFQTHESQTKLRGTVLQILVEHNFSPPSATEIADQSGKSISVIKDVIASMVHEKELTRIDGDVVFPAVQYQKILSLLKSHFSKQETLTVSQFRQLLNTSRKFALPILLHFDKIGVTKRDGEFRIALDL